MHEICDDLKERFQWAKKIGETNTFHPISAQLCSAFYSLRSMKDARIIINTVAMSVISKSAVCDARSHATLQCCKHVHSKRASNKKTSIRPS